MACQLAETNTFTNSMDLPHKLDHCRASTRTPLREIGRELRRGRTTRSGRTRKVEHALYGWTGWDGERIGEAKQPGRGIARTLLCCQ